MRYIKTLLECLAFFYASFQTVNVLSCIGFLFFPKYAMMGFDYYYSDYNYFLMMELLVFSIVLMIGVIKSKRFCFILWMSWAVVEVLFISYGLYSQRRTDHLMAGVVLGK